MVAGLVARLHMICTHDPYKNRMSGKCPENVQNNNIQIPDTVYCPENVPKRDRFRHLDCVRNLS